MLCETYDMEILMLQDCVLTVIISRSALTTLLKCAIKVPSTDTQCSTLCLCQELGDISRIDCHMYPEDEVIVQILTDAH